MSGGKLRVLIVDDEPIARERLRLLCSALEDVEVVGESADGWAALDRVLTATPDLVLLDIAMPGLDGMAVADRLRGAADRPVIVFCTADDRHALAAFEVSAVDYLLKPVSRDRLAQAVAKAKLVRTAVHTASPSGKWLQEIWVPHRGAMARVDVQHLERVDAERDYVRLTVGAAQFLLHDTITRVGGKLDPDIFVRLRRSVIVRRTSILNIRHIGSGRWSAAMNDGGTIRIGPTYLGSLKTSLEG